MFSWGAVDHQEHFLMEQPKHVPKRRDFKCLSQRFEKLSEYWIFLSKISSVKCFSMCCCYLLCYLSRAAQMLLRSSSPLGFRWSEGLGLALVWSWWGDNTYAYDSVHFHQKALPSRVFLLMSHWCQILTMSLSSADLRHDLQHAAVLRHPTNPGHCVSCRCRCSLSSALYLSVFIKVCVSLSVFGKSLW